MPTQTTLAFFAAEHKGRRITIRRTTNYDDIINSIRSGFPELSSTSQNHISLAQVFPELGEGMVEVTPELWKDAVPFAKTMQIVIAPTAPKPSISKSQSKKRKIAPLEPTEILCTDLVSRTIVPRRTRRTHTMSTIKSARSTVLDLQVTKPGHKA
ncbi:hypothetical protein RSOLAG1IB_09595 [Rhizoctonia solani AG-1 IB]|uniref:Uncharacterized protein n=1 Tax=Thanatephorus cucumeris (strain AG1-IB / isolate 7/3/14) TaxID=1108050 RepID=A0A0B7FW10_THACB|nr:hypothetical protein RSOLAG1IB_09595 [Rhizoctonia solani AG-1 IB]